MSAKHTPGPWVVKPVENEQGGFDIDSEYGYHIAETIGGLDDEEEANARLIAAAPELLALLIELVDMEGPQPGTSAWGDKARAAIAKATGGAA